ncbi:MAG TPA: roadblock/LC7 domain-containing protein [Smithellaceae bacterium]|jgi:predicted regulator of Ras-like GTPase activity (Roadblock/LC7/MglB family)|nr:roadblock/LC7 domain-containing protein [Smithella sp.]HNZ09853.1 roadblock/LC7 domain-containing protein [Smithellaceae bacterium]HOF42815.1 roadblock/LC7 domain-containing protein [Candidatus Moranbacteria bacterium]HOG80987.1 roadblock/LC7 domain-containing protein [Smithellaceae bacterium]HOQ40558.1 roadblock/LC7 domain-containing protein [Smithellaceae bacterium]
MILGQKQLDKINDILTANLIGSGVQSVMLIDTAGNVIASINNGNETVDLYSLAALAAANFGAMSCMAKIVGEDEFSLLFHKGEKENIYFCKVNEELLLVNIFNNQISLGFLRLKMSKVVEELVELLGL